MAGEVIDISPLIEGDKGSKTKEVDDKISQACKEIGVFHITGHGVGIDLMEEILNIAKKFFDLPREKKMQLKLKNSYRGYVDLDSEYTANKIDVREGFYLENEGNRYPGEDDVPGFREITAAYIDHVGRIGKAVMSSVGRGLRLPDNFFTSEIFNPPSNQFGLWHYPPHPGCTDEGPWGVGPHTDYGVLTLLLQDDVGGLQFQMRNGEWSDINPIPGTFVVNIGDTVEAWTHGAYRATLHRVKNSPNKHRYSATFFNNPNDHCIIRPLDIPNDIIASVTGGPPKLFEKLPLTFGEYLREKRIKSHGNTNNDTEQ